MSCLVVLIIILLICWAIESPSTLFIGLFIFIGLCIWEVKASNKSNEERKQKKDEEDEKNNKIFEEKKLQYNLSNDYSTVNYKNGFAKIAKDKHYLWIEDESVFFFPAVAQSKEEDYI